MGTLSPAEKHSLLLKEHLIGEVGEVKRMKLLCRDISGFGGYPDFSAAGNLGKHLADCPTH
ncbi:MAG: hypothetical protein IKZ19_04930, partial [Clostridia bacterium]|nr:hypothetical protein [Clostridia bacterium]